MWIWVYKYAITATCNKVISSIFYKHFVSHTCGKSIKLEFLIDVWLDFSSSSTFNIGYIRVPQPHYPEIREVQSSLYF